MPNHVGSRSRVLIGVVAGIFLATASVAQDAPPPIREFDVPTFEKFGQQIFEQDSHAATASDLLQAHRVNGQRERLSLWVTEPTESGERVRWLREGTNGLEAAYDVVFEAGRAPPFAVPQNRQLGTEEIPQHDAR